MRLLADENFPGDVVSALRAAGHDVLWIRTDAPGITDQDVLARSLKDARVLLGSTASEYFVGDPRTRQRTDELCPDESRNIERTNFPWIRGALSRVFYGQLRNGPSDALGEKGCKRGNVEINARAVQGAKVARAVLYSYDSPKISTGREHGVH